VQAAWITVADVDQYVRRILAHEADDIPRSLIEAGPWCQQFDVDLVSLDVDEAMVTWQDDKTVHMRRDGFVERVRR
jgi:hypothetical protein